MLLGQFALNGIVIGRMSLNFYCSLAAASVGTPLLGPELSWCFMICIHSEMPSTQVFMERLSTKKPNIHPIFY